MPFKEGEEGDSQVSPSLISQRVPVLWGFVFVFFLEWAGQM